MEHVKSSLVDTYELLKKSNHWSKLFYDIRKLNVKYASKESGKMRNKLMNRYYDVIPYDHSRVILNMDDCDSFNSGSDYINANYVRVVSAKRRYILTQGPLESTVDQFWQMVWQENSQAILMLNKVIEKSQVKCHCYWPTEEGVDHQMNLTNGFIIRLENVVNKKYFIVRNFHVTNLKTDENRVIKHFHYTTWPDFGVPSSPTVFLKYLQEVRADGVLDNEDRPAIVHCSAGIGRSGTFCLVDSCLVLIEKEGSDDINVVDVLLEMRRYRMGLIQTTEQLQFSFMAIIEGSRTLLNLKLKKSFDFSENDAKVDSEDDLNCNGDDNDDSVPPPIPPRRSESLDVSGSSSDVPVRPLPPVPDDANDEEDTDVVLNTETEEAKLRRRTTREQKVSALEERVMEIKKRQRNAEQWKITKRFLFKTMAAGIILAPVAIFIGYYWKS